MSAIQINWLNSNRIIALIAVNYTIYLKCLDSYAQANTDENMELFVRDSLSRVRLQFRHAVRFFGRKVDLIEL